MDWILSKLLSLEELTDSQVEVAKIYFAGAWPTWLIVPFALVAVGLIWTAYKKEKAQTSAGYWHFLLCLRSLTGPSNSSSSRRRLGRWTDCLLEFRHSPISACS